MSLLLVCPVHDDRRPGHPEPDDADVIGGLGPGGLLEEDRLVRVRSARTAELLGPRQARIAGLVELLRPLARDVFLGSARLRASISPPFGHIVLEPLA